MGGHTRTSIRIQYGNTLLASAVLEKALLGAILGGAGQAREVDEDGHFLGCCAGEGLWGEEEVEAHFAVGGGCGMAEFEELAAERGDCCFCCDGHYYCVLESGGGC